MSTPEYAKRRQARPFDATEVRIIVIEDSYYSRPVMMEVFRGVGIKNDNVKFLTTNMFLDGSAHTFEPDVLMVLHASENAPDFTLVQDIRRLENDPVSELPILYLSAMSTQSNIIRARDAGVDEFLSRPVSSNQLMQKLKKVVEAPERFVQTQKYSGPCRRRSIAATSANPRRRMEDAKTPEKKKPEPAPNALLQAIADLQNVCVGNAEIETTLIDRVRELTLSTMDLARDTDDVPLLQTATAVKCYMDGIGRSGDIELHVLEISAEALTQLAAIPDSYSNERASVAKLMTVAVQKKLARHQQKKSKDSSAA